MAKYHHTMQPDDTYEACWVIYIGRVICSQVFIFGKPIGVEKIFILAFTLQSWVSYLVCICSFQRGRLDQNDYISQLIPEDRS